MERESFAKDIVRQILSSDRPVVLLRGPAASGKTSAVLSLYKHFLDGDGRPACLLIGPNFPAVADLRQRCLADSRSGALVSPQVTTLAALAERILAAAQVPARMLRRPHRRLLLRRIVEQLADDGKFAVLDRAVDTPGLIVTLDRAISELKRAAIAPEVLADAIGSRRGKAGDLLAVYRQYQQQLLDASLYDVEGQMWTLRDCLAATDEGACPGLDGIDAIAIDGFTDLAATQMEVLWLLSRRVGRVLITLPFCSDGRDRMWHWTSRSLERIGERFGETLDQIELAPAPQPLARTWDGLFNFDAPPAKTGAKVELIAAAGAEAEVTAVAGRVKRLLIDGAQAGDIAVLARSMQAYREPIERIFPACDIPVNQRPQPLADVPVVRFSLQAASVAPLQEFADVLAVINSSYFRPAALGDFDVGTVAAAQMLIREGNVLAGRNAYTRAARALAQRARRIEQTEDDEAAAPSCDWLSPQRLAEAERMLSALFDLAEAAQDAAGMARLIDKLDLAASACQAGDSDLVARDLRALGTLGPVLDELAAQRASLAEVRDALAATSYPPARGESLVDVMDVLDARPRRWRHVFLLGVGEGQFPQRFVESSLISEADRANWSGRGLQLDSRGDLAAREMLLFYLAATRADESLTLSYPRWDSSGRDGAAGSFLLSVLDLLGGQEQLQATGRIETIHPGRLVPPPEQLARRRDTVVAAVAGWFDPQFDSSGGARAWAVAHAGRQLSRAAAGIWSASRRWSRRPCDSFDGHLAGPTLREYLADRFGPDAIFSASQLNSFGQCPWQFFARHVLGLKPLVRPERRLEPVALGIFAHDVLCATLRRLSEQVGGPVRLGQCPAEQVTAALAQGIETATARLGPGAQDLPALWQLQQQQMQQRLLDYLLDPPAETGEAECLHFELRFGPAAVPGQADDPASVDEPVALPTCAGPVQVAGKIDRVDRVVRDEAAGLFIVDYKTKALPSPADIDAGRNLQIAIYSIAAEQILGQPCLGGAFHGFGGKLPVHFSAIKSSPGREAYPERLTQSMNTVGRFVESMRDGQFDLLPTHDCPAWCPYRQICQFSQPRKQIKLDAAEGGDR